MKWLRTKRIELPGKAKVSSATTFEIWLAALLFPFKVYAISAVTVMSVLRLIFFILNDGGEPYDVCGINAFALFWATMALGYIPASMALFVGSFLQGLMGSKRDALWSLAFGIGALLICLLLHNRFLIPVTRKDTLY
jgi:hypothetical protein